MSDSVRPHRRQPTRLPCPWDSPGRNTGVGCHFLLQCMKVKSESQVAQSCPTLSDSMDCSLPGSSTHGIFRARVLEWGAIAHCYKWSQLLHKKKKKKRHHFIKICINQSYCFSSSHVPMWELDHEEDWVPKNWCFQIVVLESPLESKELKPVNPKGDQSWIFIGRAVLKLKLQHFGHLMQTANSLEKMLMLGKTEDRSRSG